MSHYTGNIYGKAKDKYDCDGGMGPSERKRQIKMELNSNV